MLEFIEILYLDKERSFDFNNEAREICLYYFMKIKAMNKETYINSWHGLPRANTNTYLFLEVMMKDFINIYK